MMATLGSIAFIWNLILIIQLVFGLTKRQVSVKIGLLIILTIIALPLLIGYFTLRVVHSFESIKFGFYTWIFSSLIIAVFF